MARCNDPASQANPTKAAATHAALILDVDFDTRVIRGSVEYTVEIQADGVKAFMLDTSKLTVERIAIGGSRARWVQHRSHSIYGGALEIFLPDTDGHPKGTVLQVVISFCTSPRSTAIQWLPPEQTHGGKYPYLFTQGQAIHARSLFPCQDCPSVKITYDAKVTVPKWSTCLMSALETDPPVDVDVADGKKHTFSWKQGVPIPSYLVALAVGDLDSREISHRCRIWSEPGVVERAAFDFSQTEEFLQAAEGIVGPYEWGRYDVLCLPPSFPYGGMENPCLTFVTPTLLSGDKSLAFVIAHEISHSWTGNLVTNRTWEHFWLNEGWTMWLERNIMTKVTGDPNYYDFGAMTGYRHLEDDVTLFESKGALALTKLVPNLDCVDPDDAFSSVPYEKGFALLNELQRCVGAEAFHGFALDYIKQFRRGTIDSEEFKSFFLGKFPQKAEELSAFNWDAWFYEAGMPAETPTFNETLCEQSRALAEKWLAASAEGAVSPQDPDSAKFAAWPSPQKVMFVQILLDGSKSQGPQRFSLPTLQAMDMEYGLTKTGNSEVRFCWHQLCLRSHANFIVPHVLDFVTSMGRMKFTRPLYRELFALEETRSMAIQTFRERASFYHPICRAMVAKDLGVELDEGPRTPRRSLSMASLNMSRTSSEVDFVGKGTDLNVAGLEEALKEVAGAGTTGESAAAVGALGTSSRKQRRAAISVAVGMAIVAAFASVALLKRKRV